MSKAEAEHIQSTASSRTAHPQSLKEISFLVREANIKPQAETNYFNCHLGENMELRNIAEILEAKKMTTLKFEQFSSQLGNLFLDDLERTSLLLQLVAEPNYENYNDPDLVAFAETSCDQMIEYIEKLPSAKDKEIEVLKNLFHNQNTDKEMKLELFEQISEKIQTSLVDDLCEKDDDFCKSFYRSHDSISNTFRRRFGFVAFGFNKEILDFNARETKIIDGFSKYIEILVDETGRTDDKMLYAAAETYKRFLVEFDTNFLEALLQRKMELQDNQAPSEFEIVIPQLLSPKMIVKLADDSCFQNKFN